MREMSARLKESRLRGVLPDSFGLQGVQESACTFCMSRCGEDGTLIVL
ncbi:MAG: hypothetical protein WC521_02315 [Bdellovibrionales bacterium]